MYISVSCGCFLIALSSQQRLKDSERDPAEDRDVAHDVQTPGFPDVTEEVFSNLRTAVFNEVLLFLLIVESPHLSHLINVFSGYQTGCCWSGCDPDESRGNQISLDQTCYYVIHGCFFVNICKAVILFKVQKETTFIQPIKDEHYLTITFWKRWKFIRTTKEVFVKQSHETDLLFNQIQSTEWKWKYEDYILIFFFFSPVKDEFIDGDGLSHSCDSHRQHFVLLTHVLHFEHVVALDRCVCGS